MDLFFSKGPHHIKGNFISSLGEGKGGDKVMDL
ncbi:Uncharacterised protein [Streptococcus pneumoniae]|nr:Uncharacterised protein [Streptococcus pneumoniae]